MIIQYNLKQNLSPVSFWAGHMMTQGLDELEGKPTSQRHWPTTKPRIHAKKNKHSRDDPEWMKCWCYIMQFNEHLMFHTLHWNSKKIVIVNEFDTCARPMQFGLKNVV